MNKTEIRADLLSRYAKAQAALREDDSKYNAGYLDAVRDIAVACGYEPQIKSIDAQQAVPA